MRLEVLNTLVSVLTLLVVGAAALAALVQLRHLRAANSLNGLLEVLRQWHSPEFQRKMEFVRRERNGKLTDAAYLDELRHRFERSGHPELFVSDWYEQIGSYLKYGLLDERIFLDVSAGSVNAAWSACWPAIAVLRERGGDSLFENFEYAAVRGRQFLAAHPHGVYPRGMPRMRQLPERA